MGHYTQGKDIQAILAVLTEINAKMGMLMVDETGLQGEVAALAAAVTDAVVPALDSLAAQIAALRAAGNVPQADLDAMQATLTSAQTALSDAVNRDNPTPTP